MTSIKLNNNKRFISFLDNFTTYYRLILVEFRYKYIIILII